MSGCRVRMSERDGALVASVEGELDLFSSPELGHELSRVPNDARGLVIDLSGVSYIDSSGLRVLFDIARRLHTARQHLGVSLPADSPLRRLFKLTNVAEVVFVCESVDGCLKEFSESEAHPR